MITLLAGDLDSIGGIVYAGRYISKVAEAMSLGPVVMNRELLESWQPQVLCAS